MKRKLMLSIPVIIVLIGIWFVSGRLRPEHYSRTPSEVMQNLSIAIKSGDVNKVSPLFASKYAFDKFMDVRIDSEASRFSKTPLIRHKGQSSFDAWKKWFKNYGVSALRYRPLPEDNGIVCTTEGSENFIIIIKKYQQGYLITECDYEL